MNGKHDTTPAKSRGGSGSNDGGREGTFVPLLDGLESPECVKLREELFETAWPGLEGRMQVCLFFSLFFSLFSSAGFARCGGYFGFGNFWKVRLEGMKLGRGGAHYD